jgi:hypothetical protein
MQILYGFSSRVSGENGIVKPLISSFVMFSLSDMIKIESYMITIITDVVTELSDVRIDSPLKK